MRDVEGQSARDWLDRRDTSEDRDEVAGGGPGGFEPIEGSTPTTDWWNGLEFDPDGAAILYDGKQYTPESLAKAAPAWAGIAARRLEGKTALADVNNRAVALVYADPEELSEPLKVLSNVRESSRIVGKNLKLLMAHVPGGGT